MSKMKKAVAIALAAAMTMGSTLTVFAADDVSGAGGTSGKGENEGHVEKEVINVVLPTVPEGDGSPFEYITDPERLIQSTSGARYEDYTFPEKVGDTGIYFLVGDKTYANASSTLQVINKSSCDVSVTVTATARQATDKDLALATSSSTTADNPLYLNMKVGQENATVSDSGATVTKIIAGSADNFEVQYTGGAYQYVPKVDAYNWKALNIGMNGAVDEAAVITNDTTVPTVDVTWAFAKASGTYTVDTNDQVDYEETGEPEILSISNFIKADPKNVVIKFTLGMGSGAVDADGVTLSQGASKTAVNTAKYTVDMSNKTVTIDKTGGFLTGATADVPVYVTLTKAGKKVAELSGTIVVKDDYDAEAPEITNITEFDKKNPQNVVITFSLGTKDLAVDADGVTLYQSADRTAVNTAKYTVDMNNKTVTIDKTSGFLTGATADVLVYVTLTKGGSEVSELVGTIKIK